MLKCLCNFCNTYKSHKGLVLIYDYGLFLLCIVDHLLALLNCDLIFAGTGHITDKRVEEVMLSVDRADFCSENSYQDFPQQIGYNATISAPHMVSILLPYNCRGFFD